MKRDDPLGNYDDWILNEKKEWEKKILQCLLFIFKEIDTILILKSFNQHKIYYHYFSKFQSLKCEVHLMKQDLDFF